jgi:hypothetical protein
MKNSVIIICLVIASVATAQTVQTNGLAANRSAYNKEAAKIEDDADKKKDAALIQYGKALDGILTTLKQKGDIESYPVVADEQKRFKTDKTVSTTNTPPHQFAEAVTAYRKQIQDAQAERDRQKITLLKQYVAALGTLIKDLMSKNNIEDAKAAGDEKKTAEFVLADMESRQPKSASVTDTDNDKVYSASLWSMTSGWTGLTIPPVKTGDKIILRGEPKLNALRKGGYTFEAFKVRVGGLSDEFWFDSNGRHSRWVPVGWPGQSYYTAEPQLELTVKSGGKIVVWIRQAPNVKLYVTVKH